MWELIDKIWTYFSGCLSPPAVLLLLLYIWSEVRGYLSRKNLGNVIDAKDKTIAFLTEKTLDATAGYQKLTNLLEFLVQELKK